VCRQFALIIYEVDGHLPLSPRVPRTTTLFIVPPVFPFAWSSVVALTSEIFDIIKFWYQSITKGIPNRQVGQIYLGQECCVLRKNLGVLLCKTNPVSRTTALLTTATTTFGIPLVINLVIKTLLFMTITSDVRCPKGVSRWRGWSGDKSNK